MGPTAAPALDVRTIAFPVGDPAWSPYTYNIPPQVLGTPGQILSPRVTVSGEHHFIATHMTGQVTAGTCRVLIRRNLEQFSNQAVDFNLLLGTAQRPWYMPAPFICTPGALLGVDVTAGQAQTFSMQFHGVLVETKDLEMIRAQMPSLWLANGWALSFYIYDVFRQYSANEREKMLIKTPSEYDFLFTEINSVSTGTFSAQLSWSGNVSLDDNLTPNVGYFGNAQFPGYLKPTFVPATAELKADCLDTSGNPNLIETAWAGVRYSRGLRV